MGLLRGEPREWDSAGRLDEVRQLRRLKSTSKTSLKKAIELERKQGGNPRRLFKQVMREVEQEAILPSDPTDWEFEFLDFDEPIQLLSKPSEAEIERLSVVRH